jgi:hypothetical protein
MQQGTNPLMNNLIFKEWLMQWSVKIGDVFKDWIAEYLLTLDLFYGKSTNIPD